MHPKQFSFHWESGTFPSVPQDCYILHPGPGFQPRGQPGIDSNGLGHLLLGAGGWMTRCIAVRDAGDEFL